VLMGVHLGPQQHRGVAGIEIDNAAGLDAGSTGFSEVLVEQRCHEREGAVRDGYLLRLPQDMEIQ